MPAGVQSFACPRCRRGEFRSLPGPDGKAYCPWCGDAVAAGPASSEPAPAPAPPAEPFSLEELANRIAGKISNPPAVSSPSDLEARLADSERRRELAEAELRRELAKKQEIKKIVVGEVGRLEAELAEAKERIRRKDEEHRAALQTLDLLKDAKGQEWEGDRMRLRDEVEEKERARRALEVKLEGRQQSASELQAALDTSRAELGRLHAEAAAAGAERSELRQKLSAAGAKLQASKEAATQLPDLKQQLQESRAKAAGLQADLEKRDQRIKELQLLVKTLGERLNNLADRRH